jgi:RNA polymerase sigma factor (sigma-70 family)
MNELRTAVVNALIEDLAGQIRITEREALTADPFAYEALCDRRDVTDQNAQRRISPEEVAVLEEARRQFRPTMRERGLAPRETETLWWRDIEDLTQEQTATHMGISRGTVNQSETRARGKLASSSRPARRKNPWRSGRGG